MPRRDDIKKANVILDRDLAASVDDSIKAHKFSEEARHAIHRLIKLYNSSPEHLAQKVGSYSARLYRARSVGFTKRLAVEFPKEDLARLAEALKHLQSRDLKLSQQEFIYIAIIDFKKGRHP